MAPRDYKRTILITGATDGIGRQLALELSSKTEENFVIIHGRCKRKCEETLEYLIHENKLRPLSSNLDYVAADFSHLNETCRMAEEVKLRFPKLNVFVGCASILVPRKMKSDDALELTIQVNHLSHYILWNSLLPLLESNALQEY
uniref:Uncharacterized protein n=1 Tax=Ditylenchus dipsaci TaxID=166011 RepID=A0A915CYI7_9BILA